MNNLEKGLLHEIGTYDYITSAEIEAKNNPELVQTAINSLYFYGYLEKGEKKGTYHLSDIGSCAFIGTL